MTASPPQLLLDGIRQAALPQRLSIDLTLAHAAASERLARGEDRAGVLLALCAQLDASLRGWQSLLIADLGEGPGAISPGIPRDPASLQDLSDFLKQLPASEASRSTASLPAEQKETWSRLFPEGAPAEFFFVRIGESEFLLLTSAAASPLTPAEVTAVQLIGCSTAFIASLPGNRAEKNTPPMIPPVDPAALEAHWCQAVCLLSPSGEITRANRAAAELLQTPHEVLAGKQIAHFGADSASQAVLRGLAGTTAGEEGESRLVCLRQGEREGAASVWVEAVAKPLPQPATGDDQSAGTSVVLRDMTAERDRESQLTASREHLKAAVASPALLLFQVDRHGAIVSAEGGLLESSELNQSDVVGRSAWAFCTDTSMRRGLWRQLRRQGSASTELDTEHGSFQVTLVATIGPNRRPRTIHGVAVHRQMLTAEQPQPTGKTASLPIEEAPANVLPAWLSTFHTTTDAVAIIDPDGLLRYMNLAAERLFDLRFSEAEGHPFHRVGSFGDVGPVTKLLSTPQKPGSLYQVCLRRHDGIALNLSLTGAPYPFGPEQSPGCIISCRPEETHDPSDPHGFDIQRLEQENFKALSTFAGGVAHDFNNILTSLVGNVSLANMLVTEIPEASERLVEAERACFRAKDLSHQLLTFAKGSTPVKKVTRLEDLVQQCAEFYLRGSKTTPRIINDPELWSVNVDEGQVSQVLENLILNADHSMPHGGMVTITSENFQYSHTHQSQLPLEEGLYVRVCVKDNGAGIPEDQLSNIFRPYHTANESGRGLGLATTFTIIKNHGGHIVARSSMGEGTEYVFYLPATGTTKQPDQKPLALESSENKSTGSSNGRVLVIDDEKSIRDLATTSLKLMGCDVVSCASSSEGVERYISAARENENFDLVIMDLTIPGDMGGNEAMQQILNISPNARGIASSGYSEGSVMTHYREYGFQAALSKPYSIGDLQRVVSNMLTG